MAKMRWFPARSCANEGMVMPEVERPLSARELEILKLVATGVTNAEIAHKLSISANTVKVHLRNIFAKLEVESRTEAATLAIRNGWVQMSETAPPIQEAPALPGSDDRLPTRELERVQPVLARWQRVFVLAVAILLAVVLFLPRGRTLVSSQSDPFSDQRASPDASTARSLAPRWSSEAQMPTPRGRLAVVACSGRIYAIGGDGRAGVTGVVEEYDPGENIWRRRSSKPLPLANIGAAVIGERIYVPGGYTADRAASGVLEFYDVAADSWGQLAPLPEALFGYAVASYQNKLYVFGGSNGSGYVSSVYVYDADRDAWSRGASCKSPRGFASATEAGGKIYLVGGYNGAELDLCEIYDPAREADGGNPWQSAAPMSLGRGGLATVQVGGYIYALGGGWGSYLYYNERYDVLNNLWTPVETPVLGQWRTLGAAVLGEGTEASIYAIGGWNGDYLGSTERYRPYFYTNLPSVPLR